MALYLGSSKKLRFNFAEKGSAAYVYPQILLPDIDSVWTDKETYPYALLVVELVTNNNFLAGLFLSQNPVYFDGDFVGCSGVVLSYYAVNDPDMAELLGCPMNEWTGMDPQTGDKLADHAEWTSHDILNEDGTTYLSAYTPVPAGNGMVVYKGVKLPALPEWDKTKYPYAMIVCFEDNSFYDLLIAETPFTHTSEAVESDGLGLWYANYPDFETWTFYGEKNGIGGGTNKMRSFWTNTDILNEDGTLYLAASEPVPVLPYKHYTLNYSPKINRNITQLAANDGYILCDTSGIQLITKG